MQIVQPFSPSSLEPGGSAVATISLSPLNGFNGSVSLQQCDIAPVQTTSPPVCTVSPGTVTPPASPSVTFTTSSNTPSGSYTVTVTATGGSTTQQLSLNLAVLSVAPVYTITVTGPITPTSVHAGSGATAIVTVTPVNGYSGNVTLSCSAISPVVTNTPACSFSPTPVVISGPTPQTSTLTISTIGPKTAVSHPRIFYAVWLPLPAFALISVGFGSARRVRYKVLGLTVLSAVAFGLLFLPACGNSGSSSTTTTSTTVTPKNTYVFTLDASDANSVAPSNTAQTVSLTVN